MEYREAVNTTAQKLRASREIAEFQRELDYMTAILNRSGFTGAEKSAFWEEVKNAYAKLPELLLREAAAAEKLIALMNAANALINAQKTK